MLFFMRIKNLQLHKPFEVQPSYTIKLLLILKYPLYPFITNKLDGLLYI